MFFPFAVAELSVWGAFSDLALSARPWEDPVKNGAVRGTLHTEGGQKDEFAV